MLSYAERGRMGQQARYWNPDNLSIEDKAMAEFFYAWGTNEFPIVPRHGQHIINVGVYEVDLPRNLLVWTPYDHRDLREYLRDKIIWELNNPSRVNGTRFKELRKLYNRYLRKEQI